MIAENLERMVKRLGTLCQTDARVVAAFLFTAIGLDFSGRGFARPGWAVVSTHDDDVATHTWMDDQVFVVELKPGWRVVRLAHTQSLVDESQSVE